MKLLRDLRALAVAALAAGAVIAAPGQAVAQEAPAPEAAVEPAPAPAPEAPAPAPGPEAPAPGPEAPAPAPAAPEPPAPEAPPAPVAPPVAPGADGEIDLNGRSYVIHVPADYTPERAWPVLVGYSAYRDSTENFRSYSRLRESTAGREAIIVYPRSVGGSWEGSPTAESRPGEDIAFTRAMIDDVAGKYSVDRARVYATGMSTGGGMAMVAACHLPDVFAAVAPVSGAYYTPVNMNCPGAPVSVLMVHGTGDTLMEYDGGNRHGADYLAVPDLFESYAQRNGCGPGRETRPEWDGAERVVAGGCARETEQIRVLGSNHLWWYENPDTTEEIWAFLARQHN
ncbi:alpha/beta hydrolase family esterase [Corynebacterium frankenforstense]|uniref:alpha/beta hydrolase family esterase n=1 Tax=Corynebacterium frankenforstense TaxID=1230998 RepID=UPI000950EFA8|nr:PHB depolymerase family esterase [Corynebacterium frankenforstense]